MSLIALSQYQCPDTAYSIVIIREELVFYVANSFSPNGDNLNDVFTPVMTQGYDPNNYYLFSVYNRWGEQVFQTDNPAYGWDGTFSGKLVESDVYVWRLELRATDFGERQTHFGHIMLVR